MLYCGAIQRLLTFNINKCKQEKATLDYTYTLGCKLPITFEKIDFEVTGDDGILGKGI